MGNKLVIIFLLVLILVLIFTKMYAGTLVSIILLVLYISNNRLHNMCLDAFHMGNNDKIPSARYLDDSLDGNPSTIHYNADSQHRAVADLGDGFIPTPNTSGNYLGDDEDLDGLDRDEYPTALITRMGDDNSDIKAKYDPDIAKYNSSIFHDGGNRKLHDVKARFESPVIQDIPERIDNQWFLDINKEVEYDNEYVGENMKSMIDDEYNDPWLRRQRFMSQNFQDNEYYNSLSKVDVWREDTLERFGNSKNVPSWPTQYNLSDNWDA